MPGISSFITPTSEITPFELTERDDGWYYGARTKCNNSGASFSGAKLSEFSKARSEAARTWFHKLTQAVVANVKSNRERGLPLEDGLTLTPEQFMEPLKQLAGLGSIMVDQLFDEHFQTTKLAQSADTARARRQVFAPTFVSDNQPFPWELMFDGDSKNVEFSNCDPNVGDDHPMHQFWGVKYAPARNLTDRISAHNQDRDGRMLVGLHDGLRESHGRELPYLEKVVKRTDGSHVALLGPDSGLKDDEANAAQRATRLVEHIFERNDNMIHFACHSYALNDKINVAIELTPIAGKWLGSVPPLDLKGHRVKITTDDLVMQGKMKLRAQPLVFLNSCGSGSVADDLRTFFNLAREFDLHGAGAVIATACDIPDIFAAEFARVFYGYFLLGQDVTQPIKEQTTPLPVGEALRLTRWHFWSKHCNPLGLAYGLFTPADYQVDSGIL